MKILLTTLRHGLSILALAAVPLLVVSAPAAVVGPAGYTNSFEVRPATNDWSTRYLAGAQGDVYDLTNLVESLAAGTNSVQLVDGSPADPPSARPNAFWTSGAGGYIGTRATANRANLLMATLVNNTGSNATRARFSYDLSIKAAAAEPDFPGLRAFYSLTGVPGSWVAIPEFSSPTPVAGTLVAEVAFPSVWSQGSALYLLWVDDNANATGTDPAYALDSFFAGVTAGLPAPTGLDCLLNAPTNDVAFVTGTSVTLAATPLRGAPPYTLEFFTNAGAGNLTFQSAGSSGTAPYQLTLGSLPAGLYHVYAVATDSAASPASAASITNTFWILDPVTVTLVAPANDTRFQFTNEVVATVAPAGGAAPYSVQFYLDDLAHGAPEVAEPYSHSFGLLSIADHTLRATVTDARGWTGSSPVCAVQVAGPVSATLTPTNGTLYNYGQPVTLAAALIGGNPPFTVRFYTNGQLVGAVSASPFVTNLGVLPVGSYTSYVSVVDGTLPTAAQTNSPANLLTILDNPLVVSLTSPTNGQSGATDQALTLSATAAVGAPLTVSQIAFFFDGVSAGVDLTAPYSVSMLSPSVGSHTVYAVGTDSLGRRRGTVTNQVTITPSQNPLANDNFANAIALSGPSVTVLGRNVGASKEFFSREPNHAGNFGGASLWWTWTPSATGLTTIDTSGSDFNTLLAVYTGSALSQLATVASNNDYEGNSWSRVQFTAVAGTLYRIAVDGYRAGGFEQPVATGNIVLHIQGAGGVSITTPTNNMQFTAGDPIPISVEIASGFPNPPATRVDFYRGTTLIGSDASAPFSLLATNTPAGSNTFYAVATDSTGQSWQSPAVSVLVLNLGVTLFTPVEDTMFTTTSPIAVTAGAAVLAGTITNVAFYVDGVKFGEDATAPFSATWNNVVSGSHRFTALGYSDQGITYPSQPVNFGVAAALLAYGSVWKYLDDGSDQGTNWIAPGFDDRLWASGPAPLGYGDSNGRLPATTTSYGTDANNKYPTTYFRQALVVSNATAFNAITLSLERDDGAIVFLNGTEVGRFNMPDGTASSSTYAAADASDDGTTVFSAGVSPSRFVVGTNVFAVEIHQVNATSSDIWFQMQLIGLPAIIHNLFPTVALATPTNAQYFLAPARLALQATASDPDGSVVKVEFLADGVKLGEDTNAPYALQWTDPPIGAHVLTVAATDNGGATSTSVQVPVVVYDAAGRPVAQITAPSDGGVMEGPTNLLLTATAQAIHGVTNVLFLANGVPVGQDAAAPYAVAWSAPFGTNRLVAVASDANGLSGTSAVVTVRITKTPPRIAAQVPPAGATLTNLTSLSVTFTKPVQNVAAGDLLVNGLPATQVSATPGGSNYLFSFPHPAYGPVSITWATNNAITDTEPERNPFDRTPAGTTWSYTLVDQTPPAVATQNPPAGAQVTNLTQLTVTFSEAVSGVDAGDLLINGSPANTVSGSGAAYTFSFAQPNATLVTVTWAPAHGIRDLATTPNVFNAAAPGATWFYLTPDNVPPTLVSLSPPADATVRSLLQISLLFSEPVTGVDTNDLLLNGQPARQVTGAGVGPYTFAFAQPSNGPVVVRWAAAHGITDLATPPNPFGGGQWTYLIDPDASFADKVLINEIMFNPLGGRVADEWLELHNVSPDLINLAGWRFSRGLEFTFPNVSIPAGGYLVVAADLGAFRAKYPGVTNVVGGWTGRLANNGETLELTTALGELVNRMHYASEGDWARRERGHGARLVEGLTRSGSTVTVALFGHDFTANDRVLISGADQAEYNGFFVVSSVASATFTLTGSGTPATPATGRIICRHVIDSGQSGWSWFSAADGFGSSLELVNPALPNDLGQNWLSSTTPDGTPGQANSVLSPKVAPFIQDVTHFPSVPRATDSVTISARVSDQQSNGVQSVTLFYRNHTTTSPAAFSSVSMFDDGTHNDGAAHDGLYAATLAVQANGAIMEFYVQATGPTGLTRTWPAPTWETNNTFAQLANALYQVDNESAATNMPFLRIILSGSERAVFPPSDTSSDAEMNATFLSLDGDGTQVRYNAGLRIRGAGSRSGDPKNFRLNVPNDHLWNNRARMNLNSRYVHAQLAGSVLSQRAGLPTEDARVVQVRLNGQNLASTSLSFGCYVLAEPMNGDWAGNHFPLDPDGNVYRGSKYPWNANLDYQGTNAATYQGQTGQGYYKASNAEENDWSDLFRLTYTLSANTSDANYVAAVRTNLNVEEWFLYFVVFNFFDSQESSLANGIGDDYAMYRGVVDPRFRLVGHDYDTILNQGDTAGSTTRSIWSMVDSPRSTDTTQRANFESRFLRHPEFVPIYFRLWKQQLETTFSPAQLNPLLDEVLGGWVTGTAVSDMKTFAANRRAYILTQIPTNLTVSSTLSTQSGYLYTTTPNVTLFGQAHIIDTRRVLVNGTASTWSAWQGRWTNTVTLQPGVNRVLVQSLDSNSLAFASAMVDIWYDDGTVQTVSGAISADTVWTAAGGPYNVSGSLTINSGATLTIQAGTTLYLGSGVNVTVASGGRLLAEGTATAPIRFSRTPGTSTSWGGITINGGAGSPETRIAYAHLEFNGSTALHSTGGTVFLDHLTFGNSAVQYLSLDSSSFVVQDCLFPPTTASFEPVHGTGGIKTGGRGLFLRNFWGRLTGYNDACDFTGGNRPGPIVQFIHNVFMGSDDDLLDLDSTDAWVEGNIFMHTHRNGSPDSSSAVSGGADNADTSQVTLLGNLIYDCDQAALAKQGNFFTLLNNTIVHQNHTGSQDTNTAVVILADDSTTQGAGMYLEGNLIQDAENLTRNVTTALVTYTNNLIYGLAGAPWSGPGGGNRSADPLLKHVPAVTETTNFTTWAQAQVLWDWFSLKTGSPAVGTGPNGHDFGAPLQRVNTSTVEPLGGLSLSGEPIGSPPFTTATLRVAPLCTGNGLPTAGWPDGSGFTHYRWRLDAGVWSAETPTSVPITLTGLGAGPHYVEVVGQNDAGFYQDDPVFGPDALITVSRTWVVDPAASPLRLNEVLASNGGAVNHQGTTPDLIELHNASDVTQSLAGLRLTDDPLDPAKFIFPPGAVMGPREYLVLYANNPDGTPGYHLGFNLAQEGQAVWLYDAPERGGEVLDSVRFGPQLTDLSIGRLADGSWGLTVPTFGVPNQAAALGDPTHLLLNEWLALGVTPFNSDFLELYNADPLPVSLGGLFLSDEILGWRDRHALAPLSFIAGSGCLRFLADGAPSQGPTHLNFTLRSDQGVLGLYLPDLTPIDQITYLAQWPNVSQGRSPNAGTNIVFFAQPTPGAPNPLVTGPAPNGGVLVINEVLANNAGQVEAGRTPDWVELYNGATTNVSLGDLSLTDDTLQPRRFVFPAGTVLAPGAYLRVLCDPGTTNSGPLLNTNFALQSSGGGVYLFDAPAAGGSLLSAITYGLQVANLSIGRVPDGSTNWFLCSPTPTAANRSVTSLGNPANLKVNEWMAEPGPGKDDWFELYNPDPQPVALGGLYLTDDLNNRTKHLLAPLSFLGAGTNAWQQFLADGNTGAGADHVNFSLRAAGEALGLFTATGTLIDGVVFGAQQERISAGRFPDGAATLVSFPGTDSAGESNWRRLTNVVINEVLTHTDEPLEDAIELYNLTDQPVSLGGWWLSDDPSEPRKYQIPAATVLPAHGFTVIYETVFTNRETAAIPFALSSQGDEVVLSAYASNAFTGWRTRVDFGVAANGVSFGRYVTSDGREEFVPLSRQTFGVDDPATVAQFRTGQGLPNAYPRVGPIVISEIMYHPPDLGTNDNQRDEFIELHNPTAAPVPLYDPAYPTNVWRLRNAVDFDFPPGTVIPPGGYLLVVSFDPFLEPAALAAFRTNYALGTGVVLVGPYAGKLDNANETIELKRPDVPNTNEVPYLLVERVHYADAAPWPPAADGTGLSLQRLDAAAFGDDPANWVAAAPTPGPSAAPADSDGDGLPDAWESFYGLDPHNPNDAVLDSDGDHLTNWQEFRIGTDPRDPASALRLGIALAPGGTTVLLSFPAVAGVAYELEYAETLRVPWQVLRAFAPAPTNQLIQVETPATTTTFFRLRAQ